MDYNVEDSVDAEFRSLSAFSMKRCPQHGGIFDGGDSVTPSEREEKAVARFGGMGCAQALATAYADVMGVSEMQAANLSFGFGLGMGKQLTCGAAAVMLMVAGLSGNGDKCGLLFDTFTEQMGTTACDSLLETRGDFTVCRDAIRSAAQIMNTHLLSVDISKRKCTCA